MKAIAGTLTFRTAQFFTALLITLSAALAGCAQVALEKGELQLESRSLVFGRILLERNGEQDVISVFSTPVVIRNIGSASEPRLLSQAFDKDGRFSWQLPPGQYQVSFVLHPYSGGLHSWAFSVGRSGVAYYFGDLVLSGTKRFDTLGGANMRNVVARFEDGLAQARANLQADNPQLKSTQVERLIVHNMMVPAVRRSVYEEALAKAISCCDSLAQLPYKRLPDDAGMTMDIGPETPVFDFPGGRSRFLAWELPDTTMPYALSLKSSVTPSGMPGTGIFYIFSPAVTLLDASFRPVSIHEKSLFYPLPATIMPPQAAALVGQLPASAIKGAKYLIVHTSGPIIEGVARTTTPGFVSVPGAAIPSGAISALILEPAISGQIRISVQRAEGSAK